MNFVNNASSLVLVVYIFGFFLFIIYIIMKFLKKGYLFSLFNLPILIYAFTIYVISPFQYDNQAWLALKFKKAERFFEFLDKSFIINVIGFMTFIFFLSIFEFNKHNKKSKVKDFIYTLSLNLDETILKIGFFVCVIIWYALTLTLNKGLPLFNGNRTFMLAYGSLQSIYLACNSFISIMAIYWGIKFIYYKKYFLYFTVAALTVLFTGNRGPFITGILYPLTIIFIYNNIVSIKSMFKSNLKIIVICLILVFLGLILDFIRSKNGANISFENIINKFLYGNTFSDIRDGAFVLYGFDKKFDNFLWGKNYLGDIISFIPSAMSEFRRQWSWGNFSTNVLFGWSNHYGLRGGWFLEPYLNFGWLGVIVISIILAYCYNIVERIFCEQIIYKKNKNLLPYVMIVNNMFIILFSALGVSSGFHNIYVYIFVICLVGFFKVCTLGKFKKFSDT